MPFHLFYRKFKGGNMSKLILRSFMVTIFCVAAITSTQSIAAEEGIAAYYSDVFHGRETASGDVYDKNKLTAAHKTLAFGTVVTVTDLENNKSVTVTINDRGPFSKDRIIDLSYAAAEEIELVEPGLSRVRLDIIE
jgi:rare lipoprotein A